MTIVLVSLIFCNVPVGGSESLDGAYDDAAEEILATLPLYDGQHSIDLRALNSVGAVSPLFASQFFHNVGSQYAGLILSIAGTVLSLIPFVAYKYGPALRARSKRALVY